MITEDALVPFSHWRRDAVTWFFVAERRCIGEVSIDLGDSRPGVDGTRDGDAAANAGDRAAAADVG